MRPSRPTSVRGWQKFGAGAVSNRGEFLLNKGESTDNGDVGVKVVDIYAAKYHLLDAPELPKARVQFFSVPGHTIICEGVFTRGGNRVDLPDLCQDKIKWTVIYINDINYDEGWVFFDLR